jgi:hypothetical protein
MHNRVVLPLRAGRDQIKRQRDVTALDELRDASGEPALSLQLHLQLPHRSGYLSSPGGRPISLRGGMTIETEHAAI